MIANKVDKRPMRRAASLVAAALAVNALAFAGLAAAQAPAAPAPAASVMPAETFVQTLATLAAFEQRAGRLAQVLGQSNDVRRYGRDLADDQKTLQTLSQGLAAAKIDAPVILSLPQNQQELLATLHRISDREFDRMFTDLQVQAHQEALALVQTYAQAGDNEAVRAVAAQLAPVFQQRLSQARSMQKLVS